MPLLRTTLLRTEPAGSLQSLDELFALASAMEQEAAAKYAELAEREHVDSVQRWSQSQRGKPPDPALVRWQPPGTLDKDTAEEIRTSRLMTPYRALAMAVRNEERAFAFWSYLAAFADDPQIKRAAEAMASEELGHVATLRKARRQAYRQQPDAARPGEAPAARIDAGVLERRLATQLEQWEGLPDSAQAARIRELAGEARLMSDQANGIGRFPASLVQRDAETIAEALTDAYLEGAEASNDPARLERLQVLAGRSIARLAWLRSLSA